MRLEWSPGALRDVEALRDYIARDSPNYAMQFISRLVQAVDRLAEFPRSGRRVPERGPHDELRELLFRGYRIIYRIVDDETIQIVTVVHGARDL